MKIFLYRLLTFIVIGGLVSTSAINRYMRLHSESGIFDAVLGMKWFLIVELGVLFGVAFFARWNDKGK
jgi:hypothetical protein